MRAAHFVALEADRKPRLEFYGFINRRSRLGFQSSFGQRIGEMKIGKVASVGILTGLPATLDRLVMAT